MEEGKCYTYNAIEQFATEHGYIITELGIFVVGENFIVLNNDDDNTISFVLTGSSGNGASYKCVYTD